jgi:hypothetical protein
LPAPTPIRDAFRTLWRQPSIYAAELAWRWSWGAAAFALTALALNEYLYTLVVTPTDLMLLRLRHPLAVSRALADIFHGSAPRLIYTAAVLIPALALLWIVLAALGRYTTLRALVSHATPSWTATSGAIPSLIGLHTLRVALALAGILSFLGAALVASFVSTPKNPHVGLAALIFLPLAVLVSAIWSWVSWFLQISTIFTVRDGNDAFGSLASAMDFARRCGRKTSAVSFWFGAMHVVAFVIGSTVVAYPLALAQLLSPSITLFLMAAVSVAYFAIADYLYLARLAGYLAVVEWDRNPPAELVTETLVSTGLAVPKLLEMKSPQSKPTTYPPPSGDGEILAETLEDEPLFSSSSLADEDCDEPIPHEFSPGESLPRR